MEAIRQICGKELARVFKDPKMLLSVFVVPVAVMIVVMSLVTNLAESAAEDVEAHSAAVYIANAPEGFTDFLEETSGPCTVYTDENIGGLLGMESAGGTDTQDIYAQIQEAVVQGNLDLIIEFPEDFSSAVAEYKTGDEVPQIKTYYNPSEEYSSAAFNNISGGCLELYRQQLLAQRVDDMAGLTIFTVNSDNPDMVLQDDEKAGGKMMGMLLPYFITILLFAGAMGIGTDMIAGEKERGTLASLLVSPVKRSSIVLGKVFALMIISGVSAVVYVSGMVAFMPMMMGSAESAGIEVVLSVPQIAMMAVLLVAVAFFYSTLVVLISVFARSVKEANTYVMPAYMVILLLGITTMFTTQTPADWYFAIPVYNISLGLQAILSHEISALQYAMAVGETLIAGGVLIAVIAKAFESEKVMAV